MRSQDKDARRRLSKIEKLARDICWAEWPRTPTYTTKAAYWTRVLPDKKAEYIRDAEWLVFICQKLKPLRVLQFVDYPGQAKKFGRAIGVAD